jgi:hypothetical protein
MEFVSGAPLFSCSFWSNYEKKFGISRTNMTRRFEDRIPDLPILSEYRLEDHHLLELVRQLADALRYSSPLL